MKTKIKLMAIVAGLLSVLPMTSAWASSDSFYAALKATVHSTCSGMGKVYAGTGTSAGTFDASSSSSDKLDAGSSGGAKTFYAFAQPEENYEFDKWVADSAASITATQSYGTDGSRATVTVNASTTKNGTATGTVTAYFKKKTLPSFRVSFLPAVNGSYTVDGVAAPFTTGDMTEAYTPKLVATAAEGYAVKHWYTTTDGGATKTVVSTGSSFTGKFSSSVSVGVVFASATKVTTYEAMKEELQVEDAYLEIPADAAITIPSGETVTIGALQTVIINGTNFVDGTLVNNGTVQGGGKVATHVKHVTQSSGLRVAQRWNVSTDGVISYLAYGKSTSAYESYASADGHYHMTTCADCNGTVQGTFPAGMVEKYVSVDNGMGGFFTKMTTLGTPKVIKCSIDSTVAINHVTGISGVYDAITSDVNPGNNSGLIVVLMADTTCDGFQHSSDASKNSRVYFTGVFDCAGKTFSTYKSQPTSSQAVATFVNGKFKSSKGSYTSHFSFINCSNVDLSTTYLKSNAGHYHFWDCDNATVKITYTERSVTGKMHRFYGGTISSMSIDGKNAFDVNCEVYGGTFPADPNPESGTFLYNKTYFYADHVGSTYVVKPIEQDDGAKTLAIGSTEYTTLAKAIEGAKDGDVIKIIALSEIDGTVTNGKNITIDLNGYALQGGMIVNTGTISFEDVSTENKGVVSSAIENSGTADFAFGTYSGSIVNRANGVLTTHNGIFTGAIAKEGGAVNLKGGHFKQDVTSLVDAAKCFVVKDANGRFAVCESPDGTLSSTTVSGHPGYAAKPYPADSDFELIKKCVVDIKTQRANYTRDEWCRLGELMMFYEVYNRGNLDVTVKFDRDVPPSTITVFADAGMSLSMNIGHLMVADEMYRELTALIIKKAADFGQTATVGLMYKDLFERDFNSVATALDAEEQNNGTKCDFYIELWQRDRASDYQSTNPHYVTNTLYTFSHTSMIFGAGSNVAMIRPASGAATFYPTLKAACEAATNGETVMLCNDCATCEAIAAECSFKFDANGFAAPGAFAAADGFTLTDDGNGTYTVTRDVPPVAKIGDVEYTDIYDAMVAAQAQKATLVLLNDVTADVRLTPDWSLNLNGWQVLGVLEIAEDYKTDYWLKRSGDTCCAEPYAAQVGNVKYSSLANAINAAKRALIPGQTITVTLMVDCAESVNLPEGVRIELNGKALSGTVTVPNGYTRSDDDGFVRADLTYVAKIGTETYATLKAAIDNAAEGATIRVVKDCAGEPELTVAKECVIEAAKFAVPTLTAADGYVKTADNGTYAFTCTVVASVGDETFTSLQDAVTAVAEDQAGVVPEIPTMIYLRKDCDEIVVVDSPCAFALDLGDNDRFMFSGMVIAAGKVSVAKDGLAWTAVEVTDVPVQSAVVKVGDGLVEKVTEELEKAQQGTEPEAVQSALADKINAAYAAQKTTAETGLAKVGTVITTVGEQEKALKTIEAEMKSGETVEQQETGVYQATKIITVDEEPVTVLDLEAKPQAVIKTVSKQTSLILAVPGDVTVDKVIKSGFEDGDTIVYYDGDTEYSWSYRADGKNWVTIAGDRGAETFTLPAGSAIRYERNDGVTTPVVVVTDFEEEKDVRVQVKADDWNVVANPNVEEKFDLDAIQPAAANVAAEDLKQDKIIVPLDDKTQRVYTYDGSNWGYDEVQTGYIGTIKIVKGKVRKTGTNGGDVKVGGGKGFWYYSGSASKPTIPWSQGKVK